MNSRELYNLSKEELISRVEELENELKNQDALFRQNALMNKVREYKHSYAEDFGLVVSVPAKELFKEFLVNPEAFTFEEKERIQEVFINSMEMRGAYEGLGLPISIQLSKVKNKMVPQIRDNAKLFSSIVGKAAIYSDRWLISKLKMALNETESLCRNLEDIEHFEYGDSEQFNLKAEIKDAFNKDNLATGLKGEVPIYPEFIFGDCSDIMVEMNRKSFRSHFIGNIIRNLHDHAFKDFDEFSPTPSSHNNVVWWKKILLFLTSKFKSHEARTIETENQTVREKRVRIWLKKDENNEHRVFLIIENNGDLFEGDVDDVFEKGIGEGEGEHIGLYSVRQFLNAYGATIKMYTDPENKEGYKVGFIINLPIL